MKLGPEWLRERRFWRQRADRDVEDELAFHLAMRAEILEASGLDPQSARDAALQRFGDLDEVRDRCITISHERERRMHRLEIWTTVTQHARYALRRLRAAPGFSAAVVLMLALGIGATTTVFGVIDGILLRPLPFPEPDRLVSLTHTIAISGISTLDQSDATFMLYQRHAKSSFENLAAYRTGEVNLGARGAESAVAERVAAAGVTASFFPTLRAAPERGRSFTVQDDQPGAPPVVILSSALWQRKFGGDAGIVGARIVVDGLEREVVGIMPGDFHYPASSTGVWFPLGFDAARAVVGSFNFKAVGRLRPGVTAEAGAAELVHVLPRLFDEFASDVPRKMFEQAQVKPVARPLRESVVGDVGRLLWILLGAVGLLLVIACANVASLFLVRAEGAQREVAIRMALGAGRGAVVTQYLAEALLLAVGGGAAGVLLAFLGVRALRLSPAGADLPRLAEVGIDARVMLFAIGTTVLSALAVSVLPVLRARRITPGVVLKESSRSATVGRERQRARSVLVVAQVALALVLVAGSTLMARSFAELRDVQPGFDPRGVLAVRVALPRTVYIDGPARLRFYDRALERMQALPGVQSVAITDWLPLSDDHNDSVITIEDQPLPPDVVPPDHILLYAGPTYFRTLGIPILSGRTFERPDATRPSSEVIVSRSFAERYWKGQSPIGKRIRSNIKGPWSTIVGVAGDVHMESLERPAEQLIYFPLMKVDEDGPLVPANVAIVLRTAGDPMALAPALRSIFRDLDPTLPTFDERPMTSLVTGAAARTRFVLLMLGVASVVALAMGMVGLYGVLAYGVTLRRREIGVRMALGATVADVTRMIARRGIVLAALGIGAGLLGALAATRLLHGLLYGVSPTDPMALVGTCMLLFAVALVASWLPARRAAAMDPMEALRSD
jgi:putative ABC transport system permease protein